MIIIIIMVLIKRITIKVISISSNTSAKISLNCITCNWSIFAHSNSDLNDKITIMCQPLVRHEQYLTLKKAHAEYQATAEMSPVFFIICL